MGRQRIIDREKVLEAAEEIVINQAQRHSLSMLSPKRWGYLKVGFNIVLAIKMP